MNCFLTWEEKWSCLVLCWLAKFIAKRVCFVVLRMKCWQKGGSVARGKTSPSCIILFPVYLKRRISADISCYICLSWINFDFWAKIFLLENAEFTKRLLLREYTAVVNNPSSTKLSYSKLKNAVLNPSKSFLTLKKKSALGFYRLLKDRSLKKWEKHRAHTLSTR